MSPGLATRARLLTAGAGNGRARAVRPGAQGERPTPALDEFERLRAPPAARPPPAREPVKLTVVPGARSAEVVSIARPVAVPDKTRFIHIAGMDDLKKSHPPADHRAVHQSGVVCEISQEGGWRHPALWPAGLRQDHAGARVANEVQRQLPRHRHLRDPLDVAGQSERNLRADVREGARAEALRDVLRRTRCAGIRALGRRART